MDLIKASWENQEKTQNQLLSPSCLILFFWLRLAQVAEGLAKFKVADMHAALAVDTQVQGLSAIGADFLSNM